MFTKSTVLNIKKSIKPAELEKLQKMLYLSDKKDNDVPEKQSANSFKSRGSLPLIFVKPERSYNRAISLIKKDIKSGSKLYYKMENEFIN